MKAIFIAFDQAHYEAVLEALDKSSCRGFTSFGTVHGRGSATGQAHYGSHAWPAENSSILTFVADDRVEPLLGRLKVLDEEKPLLGLRAFVWDVERTL